MEKYGVQYDESKTKTAADCGPQVCPLCHSECEKVDGEYIKKCPLCGTKPWERKP